MLDIIHFEPLTPKTFDDYIRVDIKAYNQHYSHLWPNGDTSPYINSSFTTSILTIDHSNSNFQLFLIKRNMEYVGILKVIVDLALEGYDKKEALYIDKIYIIKEASGQKVGTKALKFVLLRAKEINKSLVWLATMQKGPAVKFYKKNGFCVHGNTEIKFKQALDTEKPMFIMKKKVV